MAAWKCSSCWARHSFSLVTCGAEGTSPGRFTSPAGLRGRGQGRPRLASPGAAGGGGRWGLREARPYPVGAEGRDDVLVGRRVAVGAARPAAGVAELAQEPAQRPQR